MILAISWGKARHKIKNQMRERERERERRRRRTFLKAQTKLSLHYTDKYGWSCFNKNEMHNCVLKGLGLFFLKMLNMDGLKF